MKKFLTIAMIGTAVIAAGLPTVAQAQHRGGSPGGPRGGYYPSHPASFHGGYRGGHGGGHGWGTAGQILTGVVIGGLLSDIFSAPPPCREVVYAQPVYPQPVVRYAAPPVTVVQAVPATETVWVQNSNGSRIPVQLRRAEGGMYVGPRGEYYTGLPTNEQLRQLYGM